MVSRSHPLMVGPLGMVDMLLDTWANRWSNMADGRKKSFEFMVYDVYGLWFLDCWLLIWVLKLVSSGLWCLWSFIPQWESSKSASTYIYIYSTMKRDRWPSPKDEVHHGISSSLWLKLVIFLYNYVYNIVFIFIQSIYTVYIYMYHIWYMCVCISRFISRSPMKNPYVSMVDFKGFFSRWRARTWAVGWRWAPPRQTLPGAIEARSGWVLISGSTG